MKDKHVWQWPYKPPRIVESGSYAITTVCSPKCVSLDMHIIFFQESDNKHGEHVFANFYLEHDTMRSMYIN